MSARPSRHAIPSVILLLLLLVSTPELTATGVSGQPATSTGATSFVNHGIELMNSEDRITLVWLRNQTHNDLSIPSIERAIQSSLLSFGVRKVLLDIGWQNFTVGNPSRQQWVDDWLSASDALGIQNLVYLGQLSYGGYASPWAQSLISDDPSTRTYFSNGTAAPYFSVDNPDVAKAIEVDLAILYTYYGSHPSWTGLGTGYPQDDPYYANGSTLPIMGYSNASLQAFVNSPFFARDTNATDLSGNASSDILWSSFKQVEPSILLTSGDWMTSSAVRVYGSGTGANTVAMKFNLPKRESVIELSWYGDRVGRTSDLVARLVADHNGTFTFNGTIATANQSSGDISTTAGWQPNLTLAGNFSAGNYWVLLSSPTSNSSNCIEVYMRNYKVGNYLAYYLQGTDRTLGYTILRVKDSGGADLVVYPYQNAYIPPGGQSFVAPQVFQFNTVFLFLSDRHFNPVNGTLTVTDVSKGIVVGQGVLSQALTHGLQNWIPIQLDRVVTTVKGDNYTLTISEPNSGYSWRVVLRGLTVSPAQAGFQNQTSFWLFRLALATWDQSHTDFGVIRSNGVDAVRQGVSDAIRFKPSSNESLESISVLMMNQNAESSNYTSGSLAVGLWSSSVDNDQPTQPLYSKTVPANRVPENGWLTTGGFNLALTGGTYYWIVISTSSNSTFSLARLTSPYQSLVKVSKDSGDTWQFPGEGPSEYSYRVVLSKEILGPAVSNIPQLQLSETSKFAQPLNVSSITQVKGIYLGIFARQHPSAPNDHLLVSISPDNGRGEPSETVLASGIYYGDNITFYSADFVQFTSTAWLYPGQGYWIVIQPVGASYYLSPVVCWDRASNSSANPLVTSDNGFTWQRYSNQTTVLSYILATPVHPSPNFDTAQFFSDLQSYHNFPTDTLPLRGWNAYVQSSELRTVNDVATWLRQNTGRSWDVSVNTQSAVLQESGYGAITHLPVGDPFTSCGDLKQYLLTEVPVVDSQFYGAGTMQLFNECKSLDVAAFGQLLNRIRFFSNVTTFTGGGAPPIWQAAAGRGASPSLFYSISGSPGGPIVLWISNAGNESEEFSMSLNGTQFGLGRHWTMLDLATLGIQAGNGQSIAINKTIAAESWDPVVIAPYKGNFVVGYSDVTIEQQLQYPNQGLYSTEGFNNQSVLLLISSNSSLGRVVLDSRVDLTMVGATTLFSTQAGWYYDNSSGMLLVKFPSSGSDSLRILAAPPPAVQPSILPLNTVADALVLLLAADISVIIYLWFASHRRDGSKEIAGRH